MCIYINIAYIVIVIVLSCKLRQPILRSHYEVHQSTMSFKGGCIATRVSGRYNEVQSWLLKAEPLPMQQ